MWLCPTGGRRLRVLCSAWEATGPPVEHSRTVILLACLWHSSSLSCECIKYNCLFMYTLHAVADIYSLSLTWFDQFVCRVADISHAEVQSALQDCVDVCWAHAAIPGQVSGGEQLVFYILGRNDVQLVGDLNGLTSLTAQVLNTEENSNQDTSTQGPQQVNFGSGAKCIFLLRNYLIIWNEPFVRYRYRDI